MKNVASYDNRCESQDTPSTWTSNAHCDFRFFSEVTSVWELRSENIATILWLVPKNTIMCRDNCYKHYLDILFLFLGEKIMNACIHFYFFPLVRRSIYDRPVQLHKILAWKYVVAITFTWQGTLRMLVNLPTLKSNRRLIWRKKRLLTLLGPDCNFKGRCKQQNIILSVFMCIWSYRSSKCLSHSFPIFNKNLQLCELILTLYFDLRLGEVTRRI